MARLIALPFAFLGVVILTLVAFGFAAKSPLLAFVIFGGGFIAILAATLNGPKVKAAPTLETPESPGLLSRVASSLIPDFLVRLMARKPEGEGQVPIMVPLGTTESGEVWFDVSRSPHVLVGGATGSGKSVFLNTLIATATAQHQPETLGLVLIDPKRVELSRFRSLPHVLGYADEKRDALALLERVANTMDNRYKIMQGGMGWASELLVHRVLVVIDEFADLTLPLSRDRAERDLSDSIAATLARILALGRAAGIHVVFATQRPDRRVVDGLIKANAPTRIAFQVSNGIESRIIIDSMGAEALPGKGAGLVASHLIPNLKAPGKPVRFQGLLVPDDVLRRYVTAASSGL